MNYNPETKDYEFAEYICTDHPDVDNSYLTDQLYDPPVQYRILDEFNGEKGKFYDVCVAPTLRGNPLYRRYLRIKKNTTKRKWKVLAGSFEGQYQLDWADNGHDVLYGMEIADQGKIHDLTEDKGYVSFMAVSEVYDNYLQEAIYYQQLKESTEMSSIYLRDNIYTNIVGGIGIFGAQMEQKMQWSAYPSTDYSRPHSENLLP